MHDLSTRTPTPRIQRHRGELAIVRLTTNDTRYGSYNAKFFGLPLTSPSPGGLVDADAGTLTTGDPDVQAWYLPDINRMQWSIDPNDPGSNTRLGWIFGLTLESPARLIVVLDDAGTAILYGKASADYSGGATVTLQPVQDLNGTAYSSPPATITAAIVMDWRSGTPFSPGMCSIQSGDVLAYVAVRSSTGIQYALLNPPGIAQGSQYDIPQANSSGVFVPSEPVADS